MRIHTLIAQAAVEGTQRAYDKKRRPQMEAQIARALGEDGLLEVEYKGTSIFLKPRLVAGEDEPGISIMQKRPRGGSVMPDDALAILVWLTEELDEEESESKALADRMVVDAIGGVPTPGAKVVSS